MDEADDPEFLALPARQKRTIDRAFNRGLRLVSKRERPAKRRRLNDSRASTRGSRSVSAAVGTSVSGGGGFIDDAGGDDGGGFIPNDEGGFIPDDGGGGGFVDDSEAGGFIPEDSGGGFIDDGGEGGGFIPDDDGGGGFIPDDGEAGGGFLPDTPSRSRLSTRSSTPAANPADRIPLRLVPSLLGALGLPTDEDVLAVFRASAEGWGEGDDEGEEDGGGMQGKGKGKGKEKEKEKEESVSRKDFRAVCAALMEVDEGGGDGEEGEDANEEMDLDELDESSDDDDEDAFRPSDDDDEFVNDDDDDGEYGAPSKKPKKPRARGGGATKGRGRGRARAASDSDLEEAPAPKLSGQQRELARELWDMLKPGASGVGSHVLGFMEVKRWAREMGEMWSEDEIKDMVTLFSSQHEGRGLTFEDFGVVMLRAGLV